MNARFTQISGVRILTLYSWALSCFYVVWVVFKCSFLNTNHLQLSVVCLWDTGPVFQYYFTLLQILGAFAVRDGVPMQGMKIKNVVPGETEVPVWICSGLTIAPNVLRIVSLFPLSEPLRSLLFKTFPLLLQMFLILVRSIVSSTELSF